MALQRLKYIAYLQIIGIILVVVGHSFHEYPDGSYGKTLLMYRMMHNFRMPLFIFVSGFLMMYTTELRVQKRKWTRFAKDKLLRLMLPFCVLSLVTFIPRSMMSFMADDDISASVESLVLSLIYPDKMIIPYYWFLQASFLLLVSSYMMIVLLRKTKIKDIYKYSLFLIASIVLYYIPVDYPACFSIDLAAYLAIFFFCGVLYARFSDSIDSLIKWESLPTFTLFACTWSLSFFITENTVFAPISSIMGIAMCISAAKILESHHISFLDHLIGSNYMIFLISWYLNVACQQVLHYYTDFPWWVYTCMSIIAGIYIPWFFYRKLSLHPHAKFTKAISFLLGQNLCSHA